MNARNEKLHARGVVRYRVYQGDTLVSSEIIDNLIVDLGYETICLQLAGQGVDLHINKIGFGTGTTPVAPGDTGITGAFIKSINAVAYPDVNQVEFQWSLELSENNGVDITEFAMFSHDGTTLFSKIVRAPISKTAAIRLEGTWTIIF